MAFRFRLLMFREHLHGAWRWRSHLLFTIGFRFHCWYASLHTSRSLPIVHRCMHTQWAWKTAALALFTYYFRQRTPIRCRTPDPVVLTYNSQVYAYFALSRGTKYGVKEW